jgi:carbohydrate kinase (thermoresistant glucokinase family)
VVLACSALRERYRERLAHRLPALTVVHLRGSPETIAKRLAERNHRYMPASLLRSQFDALEPPNGAVIEIDITPDVGSIVQTLLKALRAD